MKRYVVTLDEVERNELTREHPKDGRIRPEDGPARPEPEKPVSGTPPSLLPHPAETATTNIAYVASHANPFPTLRGCRGCRSPDTLAGTISGPEEN